MEMIQANNAYYPNYAIASLEDFCQFYFLDKSLNNLSFKERKQLAMHDLNCVTGTCTESISSKNDSDEKVFKENLENYFCKNVFTVYVAKKYTSHSQSAEKLLDHWASNPINMFRMLKFFLNGCRQK